VHLFGFTTESSNEGFYEYVYDMKNSCHRQIVLLGHAVFLQTSASILEIWSNLKQLNLFRSNLKFFDTIRNPTAKY